MRALLSQAIMGWGRIPSSGQDEVTREEKSDWLAGRQIRLALAEQPREVGSRLPATRAWPANGAYRALGHRGLPTLIDDGTSPDEGATETMFSAPPRRRDRQPRPTHRQTIHHVPCSPSAPGVMTASMRMRSPCRLSTFTPGLPDIAASRERRGCAPKARSSINLRGRLRLRRSARYTTRRRAIRKGMRP